MNDPLPEIERLRCEVSRLRARAIAAEESADRLRAELRVFQRLFRKIAFQIEGVRDLGLTEQEPNCKR